MTIHISLANIKLCRNCNCQLDDTNWMPSLKAKNSAICRKCSNEKGNIWRRANSEKVKANGRERYYADPKQCHERIKRSRKNTRIETLLAYGGVCVNCGIADLDVLDIDHIFNDGASERKANLFAYNLFRKLKKEGYPKDRYQVLCKNCNWKKELHRRQNKI